MSTQRERFYHVYIYTIWKQIAYSFHESNALHQTRAFNYSRHVIDVSIFSTYMKTYVLRNKSNVPLLRINDYAIAAFCITLCSFRLHTARFTNTTLVETYVFSSTASKDARQTQYQVRSSFTIFEFLMLKMHKNIHFYLRSVSSPSSKYIYYYAFLYPRC